MLRRRFRSNDIFNRDNYLTVEALEDEVTVSIDGTNTYFLFKKKKWIQTTAGGSRFNLSKGEKVSVKRDIRRLEQYSMNIYIDGSHASIYGNILSLVYGDESYKYDSIEDFVDVFNGLFSYSDARLEVHPNLLPFKTLSSRCYYAMFLRCPNLQIAPELPATTLATDCYAYMFKGCRNINYIKMLATDISANCLSNWVSGVSSTGTFVKSKDATWDVRGASGIPSNWKIEYDHNYDIGSDISFHIDRIDETLYAKDWMTWDDWVHSKYNTVSARISSGHEILISSYSKYALDINLDNIIKNGGTYYFRHFGGGSD